MAWIYLIVAGLFEMVGVAMINKYHRDRKYSSLGLLLGGFAASFLFLSLAMKSLPMAISYAVWTGIGVVGGALIGMLFYGESRDWKRISLILVVLGSVIGLKWVA